MATVFLEAKKYCGSVTRVSEQDSTTGRGELALALGDSSVADAKNGVEDAGFKAPLTKLRAIAGAYPNYIQISACIACPHLQGGLIIGRCSDPLAHRGALAIEAQLVIASLRCSPQVQWL